MAKPKLKNDNVEKLSEPCQVPIKDKKTGQTRICGTQWESLRPHLRSHKLSNGKSWTLDYYKKKFEKNGYVVNVGRPSSQPTGENFEKTLGKSPIYQHRKEIHDQRQEEDDDKEKSYLEKIEKRTNELWDQLGRDITTIQMVREVARGEARLEELNARYDQYFKAKNYKEMAAVNAEVKAQTDLLRKNMEFLDMSVAKRREKNLLGNDTVAQIVSNFAQALRKMSPERREIFRNRSREVRQHYQQRVRDRIVAGVVTIAAITENATEVDTDYDSKLAKYVERGSV